MNRNITIVLASILIFGFAIVMVVLDPDQKPESFTDSRGDLEIIINISDSLTTFGKLTKIEMFSRSGNEVGIYLYSANDTIFCEFPIMINEGGWQFKNCVFIEKEQGIRSLIGRSRKNERYQSLQ